MPSPGALVLVSDPAAFSERLRWETQRCQELAEKAGFIRGFLSGLVDLSTYVRLLAGYRLIYGAMEDALATHAEHPVVGGFRFPGLARTASLNADLAYFEQHLGQTRVVAPSAARAYAERIAAVSANSPDLLVAHFYTRYLGDVAGSQTFKGILRRSLDLPAGGGCSFYDYPDLGDSAAFQRDFRARLACLPVSDLTRDAIVAEANLTLRFAHRFFAELESNPGNSFSRHSAPGAPGGPTRGTDSGGFGFRAGLSPRPRSPE